MEQITTQGKRLNRAMKPETKAKLSVINKGKKHTEATKKLISQKMQEYWQSIPYAPTQNNNNNGKKITNYGQ